MHAAGVSEVTPSPSQSRYKPIAGQAKKIGDPTDDQRRNEQDDQQIKQDCDHKKANKRKWSRQVRDGA